jgi:predicted RNA binding protein YcfA (HicA-like mRNA interferase family)
MMKVRDVIRLIEADGWYLVATKESHRHSANTLPSQSVPLLPVIQAMI